MKKFFVLAAIATTTALTAAASNDLKHFDAKAAVKAESVDAKGAADAKDVKSAKGALDAFNASAAASFNADFKGATGVWNFSQGYNEVLFFWKGDLTDAYYDMDGNLIGAFHEVNTDRLPARASEKIASWYKGYTMTFASVLERNDQDPVYYVTVENPQHRLVLEVNGDGMVQEYKQIR